MPTIEDIIALIVFGTLAISIIISTFTGFIVPVIIADISKTIIGFMFGKKYGEARKHGVY